MSTEAEEGSRESHLMAIARQHLCTNYATSHYCQFRIGLSRLTQGIHYIHWYFQKTYNRKHELSLAHIILYLLWQTVFNEVKVEIAFPLNVYGHDSPGGGQGAVVAAGRLHHVTEPEDVTQTGVRVPGVVGAHRVVDQVVAMILVSEIRKPNMSVIRKPDSILVKLEINSGKTGGI